MAGLSDSERRDRRARRRAQLRRRRRRAAFAVLAAMAVAAGLVVLLATGGSGDPADRVVASATSARGAGRADRPAAARDPRPLIPVDRIPPAVPGPAEVVQHGPARGRMVALTFDDGFCPPCVTTLIRNLRRTGAHATLFPNGTYDASWRPHARAIRAMVARGQLIVGSHTFSHVNSPAVGQAAFAEDLRRNEEWIQRTFGLTGRPYLRPPYGAFDDGTLAAAGEQGYTKVVMWNGTVADSTDPSAAYILNAIRHWARPGAIILLHANYATTPEVLPRMLEILRRKRLRTATLQELIGGSPYRARPAR